MKFLNSKQKKAIQKELDEIYGIRELNYLLIEAGKKKIRGFSGNLSKEEIYELVNMANVEVIGMYLLSKRDEEIRLNFDSCPIFQDQIARETVKINKEQLDLWMRGQDLEIKTERGIAIIEYNNDLVGVGKSNTEKIFNYVPKERKLKTPLPKKSQP